MSRQEFQGTGVVESWNTDEGWGTVALDDAGMTAWVHFSAIIAGPSEYRSLAPGQLVRCRCEVPGQDGYPARAVEVTKLS
ncbi:cold-shock protein [Micromonospora haikouensis]|uniref:cold-shock protein n=1 Tax=Micromonospora haikouensis TaxID=686309 RepID=UPI0037AA321D